MKGELKAVRNENEYLREKTTTLINSNLTNQIITQLKEKQLPISEEQEIINRVKDYLGAKRIFLNSRQITIKGLQNCYNKLKGNKKYAKVDEVGKIISAGGTVASSLTFGASKAFGVTVSAINNSFKRKFSDNREKEFQEI